MLLRQIIGCLFLLVGALAQLPVFAEEASAVGQASVEVQSTDDVGLNFDTVFETYIGPIAIDESDDGADAQSNGLVYDPPDSALLQLPPTPDIKLSRIRDLRSAGALTLAESLLVAGLPAREGKSNWFDWHRELWNIREENDQSQRLIESLVILAERVEGDRQLEVLERLLQAQQKSGDFLTARAGLRDLFLRVNNDPVRTARLRRFLIENYLESGLLADAEAASVRYQEEYLPDDTEWNLLRGQILIKNRQPSKAVAQLVGLQDRKARLMLALARLNEGSLKPAAVIDYLETDKEFASLSPELEHLQIAIVAEAAHLENQPQIRAKMLENLLVLGGVISLLPAATPEQLLDAYHDLATIKGNEDYLLLGSDVEWVKYASELPLEEAVAARAVYALVLQNDGVSQTATAAHSGLIDLLITDGLYRVVLALYGDESPLGPIPDVGDALLLRLSRRALEARDYSIAAEVVTKIDQLPEGMTKWHWQLQVARLEIFSGQSQAGADRLLKLLGEANEPREQELDQLLQVVFDLQAISRDDLALKVFEAAGPFAHTVRQRRELLFWMGESQIGQDRFAQGADLLLQSAEVGGQELDLWGQSARFRAAEALVEAGFFQDAFNVYRSLLKESANENNQLQLRQKLQNLNLMEAVRLE